MKRVHLLVGGAVLGALVMGAPPSHADVVQTPPGAVSSVQLSLAMDNDWQFLEGECLFIPVLATYGRADNTSIIGELTVTKPSDPTVSNDATFLVLPGDPASGQLLDEIFVCPADGTGEFRLSTVIRAIEPMAEQSFTLDPLTFWVRPAVSRIADLSATSVKGGARVAGTVRAGDGDGSGFIEIRIRRPGVSQWVLGGRVPVEEGSFAGVIERSVPPGSRVRATLTQCSWCTRVSSTIRVS
jgi:hypothetical protein